MDVIALLFNAGGAKDKDALDLVEKLSLSQMREFDEASPAIRAGFDRMRLWEIMFKANHPLTYERLKLSVTRRKNAEKLLLEIRVKGVLKSTNVWRGLLFLDADYADQERAVWKSLRSNTSEMAINIADEFGIDQINVLDTKLRQFRSMSITDGTEQVFDLNHPSLKSCVPVQAWSVPFQRAALILWRGDDGLELIMHNQASVNEKNLNLWSINYNEGEDEDDDFVAPGKLQGDYTLYRPPIVASTEARIGLRISCFTATIRKRDTLFFDSGVSKQCTADALHWKQLLTTEIHEARNIPVTASCFVLDSLMLFASEDGILRAHPRQNPLSVYHVEDLGQMVTQMTSLYNIVAIVLPDTYTLEVRAVTKTEFDPFIRFRLVFKEGNIDPQHRPLLYGGFVLFATLRGEWKRARYDAPLGPVVEAIPSLLDWKGWRMTSIKNANWRYWTVVMEKSENEREELILFTGPENHKGAVPFLISNKIK